MTSIRFAIEHMSGVARQGFPKPPTVLPHIYHAFALLGSGVDAAEDLEELLPFLRRCQEQPVASLRRGELNRLLKGAWCDSAFDDLGLSAVARAQDDERTSSTRNLIDGYLLYFPYDREVIGPLSQACERQIAAKDNPWSRRAGVYKLFRPDLAPTKLAESMASDEPDAFVVTCLNAGLGASPFATRIGQVAFAEACLRIAALPGERALVPQRHLLDLVEREEQFDAAANIVRALLEPWRKQNPPPALRQAITSFLLDRVADPRLSPQKQKWLPIRTRITEQAGEDTAEDVIGVLRRWLTDVAMRTFFKAIAETTDRRDQWKQRQAFWLAYLDAGVVGDAWPALGPRAQNQIRSVAREQGERLDHGTTQNGPTASSSLLLQIGDLVISEWSDNGYCRFWSSNNSHAPVLYRSRYDNSQLRTMTGKSDFAYVGHDAGGVWVHRIARLIYERTGVPHPLHGRGYR
jgi:hypothetical protein